MARVMTRARTQRRRAARRGRGRAAAAVVAVLTLVGTLTAASATASAATSGDGCSASVSSGPVLSGRFHGVVRPTRSGVPCPTSGSTPSAAPGDQIAPSSYNGGSPPLTNHGGPVMSTPAVGDQVVVTPIYWAPSGYSFTSSYKNVINTYLADLAADSDKTTNVFGTTFQYSGSNGAINYRMTRGTPIADGDAFPAAGCTTDTGAIYADSTGYSTCLDDTQVTNEIDNVVAAHGLTRDLGHLYVMFLPKGVESCFYPAGHSGQQCTINSTPTSAFCAYHSSFDNGGGDTVYANMPFPIYFSSTGASCTDEGLSGGSQIQQPNGDPDADVEISPLSHEMAESITDPDANAWYDSKGYENGDECAYIYGTLSGSAGAYYNQTINGDHYLTQEEFSNSDYNANHGNGCQPSTPAVTPAVSGLSSSTGPDTGGSSLTITGTGFPGSTAVRFGSVSASYTIVDATHITATVPAGVAGTVDVTVATSAGTSATGSADQYTYTSTAPAAPTVTGLSPSTGSTAGGDDVTITGAHLTDATAVTFGSTAATFTVTDATHIDATAPAETAGTVHVTVTTAGGTSATSSADQYTYTTPAPPAPTVAQVSPNRGPAAGGTKVTITGTNLSGATSVSFGAHLATGVTVTDPGHITVTAPAGTAASTVDVRVTTSGGTSAAGSADRYHYLARPRVTSLSLLTGTRAGGTKLVISGTGFTKDAVVRFGTKVATTVTVKSSTRIVVRTPPHGRATVDVAVVTAGGTSARVRADRFRYV